MITMTTKGKVAVETRTISEWFMMKEGCHATVRGIKSGLFFIFSSFNEGEGCCRNKDNIRVVHGEGRMCHVTVWD